MENITLDPEYENLIIEVNKLKEKVAEKIEDETAQLEGNIGYLEISSFDEGTAEDFKTKFEQLKSEGITSLIIDLRNNGGGIVDEALAIADYIVPKGKDLLITVDKDGNEEIEK